MDCGASKEPLLGGGRPRGHRPYTLARTGRRGRLNALAADPRTLAGSSSDFSKRHTRALQDTGEKPVAILNRLLNTLQENGVPGPQLFRLHNEFSEPLGQGGQGNVRGLNPDAAKLYENAHESIRRSWPADCIAIKQHLERKGGYFHKNRIDRNNLSSRFLAAECEVLALAPGLFRDHPNIVRLVGWGLCLDTAEDPTSLCCGGLQLPLLVFERAEMNLSQLLEKIFAVPRDQRSDEVCLEEGLGVASRTNRSRSLLGLTWRSLWSWIRARQDVYSLVRLLCIDVGQGLESLHENNFTHGDLKPDNILVFRERGRWRAKLCDFGCAMGHDSNDSSGSDKTSNKLDTDPKQKRGATYLGTPGWQPPDREIETIRGFDDLRRCDLYVYGLLVWSSFCREGRPYSGHPRLRDMLGAVEEITIPTNNRFTSAICKQWIASQVTHVLEDTMKEPKERSLEPWTLLHRRATVRWEREQTGNVVQHSGRASNTKALGTNGNRFQLSLEMKEAYNKLAWWPDHGQEMEQTSHDSDDDADSVNGDSKPGPASSVVLNSDQNCLSTKLFHSRRRMDDLEDLHSRMSWTLHNLLSHSDNQSFRQNLYYLARFRSRVPLEWWKKDEMSKRNILQEVLQSFPSVDMHTLAWLCAGPIGRDEVMRLNNEDRTWKSLMESELLDDSERLNRFLLLLQFGAPITSPSTRPNRRFHTLSVRGESVSLDTILVKLIESFRSSIVVTVLRRISQGAKRARDEGFISDLTWDYFVRVLGDDFVLSRIFPKLDLTYAALDAARQGMGIEAVPPEVTETSAPSSRNDLPHGWTTKKAKKDCYVDGFTHSVTLTKPLVSPLQLRQLTVGFLEEQEEDGTWCHVDVLECMRAGSSPGEDSALAQDLQRRFPYYDEAWYMTEWNTEPIVIDVLKGLKDRIEPFASRLGTQKLDPRTKFGALKVIFIFTSTIVILAIVLLGLDERLIPVFSMVELTIMLIVMCTCT